MEQNYIFLTLLKYLKALVKISVFLENVLIAEALTIKLKTKKKEKLHSGQPNLNRFF